MSVPSLKLLLYANVYSLRAGSAAPGYFTPFEISDLGPLQDGGITLNYPGVAAVKQAKTIFPMTPRPGLVLSLSTSLNVPPKVLAEGVNTRTMWWHPWKPYFLRLIEAAEKIWSLNSHLHHDLLAQQYLEGDEYYRFHLEHEGKLPGLDDVSGMVEFKRSAGKAARESRSLEKLARQLVAHQFYFELETRPQKSHGHYACTGRVQCRLSEGPSLQALSDRLSASSAYLSLDDQSCHVVTSDSALADGLFSKRFSFNVLRLETKVYVQLKEGGVSTI